MIIVWDVLTGQFVCAYGPFIGEIVNISFALDWRTLTLITGKGAVSVIKLL
jgi:hypothetical protein